MDKTNCLLSKKDFGLEIHSNFSSMDGAGAVDFPGILSLNNFPMENVATKTQRKFETNFWPLAVFAGKISSLRPYSKRSNLKRLHANETFKYFPLLPFDEYFVK